MRVLWIEASCGNTSKTLCANSGLGWLRQRIGGLHDDYRISPPRPEAAAVSSSPSGGCGSSRRQIELSEFFWQQCNQLANLQQQQQLTTRLDGGVERIVVACTNRLDYPSELIRWLQVTYPEVPLALGCENWWDGWRRTGLKTSSHLSLPWYRWWDGWVAWLKGENPRLFEPAPRDWCYLFDSIGTGENGTSTSTRCEGGAHGLIVGNCRQTMEAWSLAASEAGYAVDCLALQNYLQQKRDQPQNSKARWILWDDSCLDTSPAGCRYDFDWSKDFDPRMPGDAGEFQPSSPDSKEDSLLIAAVSLPRADGNWPPHASGVELLAKPGNGVALQRLLSHYFPH